VFSEVKIGMQFEDDESDTTSDIMSVVDLDPNAAASIMP